MPALDGAPEPAPHLIFLDSNHSIRPTITGIPRDRTRAGVQNALHRGHFSPRCGAAPRGIDCFLIPAKTPRKPAASASVFALNRHSTRQKTVIKISSYRCRNRRRLEPSRRIKNQKYSGQHLVKARMCTGAASNTCKRSQDNLPLPSQQSFSLNALRYWMR